MKRIIYIFLSCILFVSLTFALASCRDDGEKSNTGATITLNVYNWGEYISDGSLGTFDTNAAFEEYYYERFGVRVDVNYTTYPTNEDMYSRLSSGAGTYDIVVPSDYMIERMIKEDMLLEWDVTELENYHYIDEDFRSLFFDPDNRYSVPYTYGKVAIIYNATMVDEEDVADESWNLMWNEKYAGKILQFNNPRDGMATAMFALGLDINSTNKDDWDKSLQLLAEQKPLIQAYVSDEIFNKMISNSASIAPYYAGDYLTMVDSNPDLAFYYPKEGTNTFVDSMCIPKNAKHPEIAKEYINFMLSEEPAVANALFIGYASPNTIVTQSEEYIDEMGEEAIEVLYGGSDSESSYPYDTFYHSFTPDMQSYTNSLWEDLKTQSSTEVWVHVLSITIVVILLGGFGVSTYIKKKRSHDYRMRDKALKQAKNTKMK